MRPMKPSLLLAILVPAALDAQGKSTYTAPPPVPRNPTLSVPAVRHAITRATPLIAAFGDSVTTEPVGGHGLGEQPAGPR